ncbi:hypothetical protein [Paenibacillus humicus]|uniref:hypothetical protein n=1 Tax=Paenibacillus humicus TaxID=412861 RepID=UPI003D279B4D
MADSPEVMVEHYESLKREEIKLSKESLEKFKQRYTDFGKLHWMDAQEIVVELERVQSELTEKDAIIDVLVGQITDETAISAKAIVEQDRLRKALDEARKYPRQPNNEGGWTIKSEFLAEVSEMTEDGEYCSMEQVENVLLCAEWLLGEGDKE